MPAKYPKDLASQVHSQLGARKTPRPPLAVLAALFEVLYFASLKSEEAERISCRIAFVDRSNPDPNPPKWRPKDRWRHFALDEEVPFNVRNLVKLSKAVDPWVSTLAVDTNSAGELRIWGLIDQSVHYSTFVMKETDTGVEIPGIFQAVIEGLGDIAVYRRYVFLGSLRQDTLVTKQQRVLQNGPVHEKLLPSIRGFQNRIARKVGRSQYDLRGHWDESLEDMWVSALCRILIGIRRYGHGGAILISDRNIGLKPKYSLQYPRLAKSLVREGILLVQSTASSDIIYEECLDENEDHIPASLYLDESVAKAELEDTQNEITGCIRFIGSLSRVDGLIWMKHDLSLQGFGVEITTTKEPEDVFSAQNSAGTRTRKIDMNHYGTRHRSMIRYCAANPDSIGFVISQDGDVRAITNVGGKVFLWDDVRLHSILNARVSKRTS
jgi:Probable sensor domain DACNV